MVPSNPCHSSRMTTRLSLSLSLAAWHPPKCWESHPATWNLNQVGNSRHLTSRNKGEELPCLQYLFTRTRGIASISSISIFTYTS
ncbi:hypothetical protein CC79DRAFT_147026 [Sarocladium strictum]